MMTTIPEATFMLDLTNAGARREVSVRGVDQFTASVIEPALMGSAVVTIRKVIGGQDIDFSTPVTIDSATSVAESLDVAGIEKVVFVVTTSDDTVADGHFAAYGEEDR